MHAYRHTIQFMTVTIKQLVESWERYIHAPRLLRAKAYEAFDQQMIAAGEQLSQDDAPVWMRKNPAESVFDYEPELIRRELGVE